MLLSKQLHPQPQLSLVRMNLNPVSSLSLPGRMPDSLRARFARWTTADSPFYFFLTKPERISIFKKVRYFNILDGVLASSRTFLAIIFTSPNNLQGCSASWQICVAIICTVTSVIKLGCAPLPNHWMLRAMQNTNTKTPRHGARLAKLTSKVRFCGRTRVMIRVEQPNTICSEMDANTYEGSSIYLKYPN